MLLIALRKGGSPCSTDCPMNPWMADCDIYNVHCIDKLEVTEEQWKAMQKAIHKRAIKQRKLYPEDHAEIHAVGCEWTRTKGKWNSEKSKNVL